MSRTRRLVSTARISVSEVLFDAFFHLRRRSSLGRTLRKQGSVDLFRSKLPGSSDDDLFPDLVPFKYSAGPYPESASDLGRDGNLPLCRQT